MRDKPNVFGAVRAVLEKEGAAIETGSTFFLHFLFPLSEVWYPLTDGRMTRKQAVLDALDGVVDRYVASLRNPPQRWREPVLFITPHEPGEARTGDRWRLEPLGTGAVENSRASRNRRSRRFSRALVTIEESAGAILGGMRVVSSGGAGVWRCLPR